MHSFSKSNLDLSVLSVQDLVAVIMCPGYPLSLSCAAKTVGNFLLLFQVCSPPPMPKTVEMVNYYIIVECGMKNNVRKNFYL